MAENVYWYKPNKEDFDDKRHRAGDLILRCSSIEDRQSAWHELNYWNATLRYNRELAGFRWGDTEASAELWPDNLRTENLIENIAEAMLSKASSSPLKPVLMPLGNSWSLERKVRRADNFLFGAWRQTNAEDACIEAYNDAFTAHLGCVKVSFEEKDKCLTVDSVFFDNIIIDNRECAYRNMPKTYMIRTVLPRESVEARWDVKITKSQEPYVTYRSMDPQWVAVIEAWRLPDNDGSNGYHMVVCEGEILMEEKWKHEWVPLVFFHWQDRLSGFFGKSGVEQVMPYQLRQNELNDDIKDAQDRECRSRWLVNANTQIDPSQWGDKSGGFVQWSGITEPKPVESKTNMTELYNERERNRGAAFSYMGLSEQFAMADLPDQVRLDSSAGVREQRNLEDRRHLRHWTNFEKFRLNVAKTMMRVLATSKNADAYTAVYVPGGNKAAARAIPYEDIKELSENQYSWALEAVPMSSQSPAARRETLRDMVSRNEVKYGSEEAKRMVGNPNLELIEDLEMSSSDAIKFHIETMEDGGFLEPNEMTNLSIGSPMVLANYNRLLRFTSKEDKLALKPIMQNHIKWLVKAESIKASMAMPQSPMAQGVEGAVNPAMAAQGGASGMTPFQPTQGMPGTSAAVA